MHRPLQVKLFQQQMRPDARAIKALGQELRRQRRRYRSWLFSTVASATITFSANDFSVDGRFDFDLPHCRDYGRGLQTACRSKHRPEHLRVSRPFPGGPANANSLVAWEPAVRVVDRVCFSEPSAVQNQRVDWSDLPPIVFLTSCQNVRPSVAGFLH